MDKYGYTSYPLDEISLDRIDGSQKDYLSIRNKWASDRVKNKSHNFSKSNFPNVKAGKRPVHNNVGLPNPGGPEPGLEVEYEERVLKPILKAGRCIYAINFTNIKTYEDNKDLILSYLKKYPHIKILIGRHKFEDVTPVVTEDVEDIEEISRKDRENINKQSWNLYR